LIIIIENEIFLYITFLENYYLIFLSKIFPIERHFRCNVHAVKEFLKFDDLPFPPVELKRIFGIFGYFYLCRKLRRFFGKNEKVFFSKE